MSNTFIFCMTFGFLSYATQGLSEMAMDATLFRCCNIGLNAAASSGNCTSTSLDSMSHVPEEHQRVCSTTLELCCARKLRELDCEDGKMVAQNGDQCSTAGSADDQYCCEACKLGLMTRANGSNCNLGRVNFGTLWGTAYQSCCRNADRYPAPDNDLENMCETLPGELCAHNCHPMSGSYKCSCRPGYVLLPDGKSCEEDFSDKCQTHENHCSQLCHSKGSSVSCSCYSGYSLARDNITCLREDTKNSRCELGYQYNFTTRFCSDLNECEQNNPCNSQTEDCFNTKGSYRCVPKRYCGHGYRFNSRKNACTDIDECEENPCDSTQTCQNTDGAYDCLCRPGYQLDKLTLGCLDVNECQIGQAQCKVGERCDNTIGSYLCVRYTNCGTGYTFNAATGKCEDNDECAMGTHDCHLAGPDRVCTNVQGSFRCVRRGVQDIRKCPNNICNITVRPRQCSRGSSLINGVCEDINECERGTYLCNPSEVCVNTLGSYRCSEIVNCKPGFKLAPDRKECIDIDECLEQSGLCSHSCINRYGTYSCGCNPGFKLDVDNRTCIDINECEVFGRLCIGICINELGSYSCSCPRGYKLSGDGVTCLDIDECRDSNTCPDSNNICMNMRGTYRCAQVNCPPGYERDLSRKNRCKSLDSLNVCREGDMECRKRPLSYTTNFFTITSNMTIPPSGLEIYNLKGPVYSSTNVRFKMDVIEAHVAPHVKAANKESFRMRISGHNQVSIAIVRTIEGPQDIIIQVSMDFYTNGIYGGTSISNLEIYVSQYSF